MPPMHVVRRKLGRYITAAVRVLAAARCPLTAGEIAEEAMACGLMRPDGTSPAAAMFSTLKRHAYGGPVVRLTGRGAAHWTLQAGEGATPNSLEEDGMTGVAPSFSN